MHSRSVATANRPHDRGPQDCCLCNSRLQMALVLAGNRVVLSSPDCKGMYR